VLARLYTTRRVTWRGTLKLRLTWRDSICVLLCFLWILLVLNRLNDWLIDLIWFDLIGWLVGWLIDWLIDWLTDSVLVNNCRWLCSRRCYCHSSHVYPAQSHCIVSFIRIMCQKFKQASSFFNKNLTNAEVLTIKMSSYIFQLCKIKLDSFIDPQWPIWCRRQHVPRFYRASTVTRDSDARLTRDIIFGCWPITSMMLTDYPL